MTEAKEFRCFKGVAFRLRTDEGDDIAVFAADIERLRLIWPRLTHNLVLNESMCQEVVVLSSKMFDPQPKPTNPENYATKEPHTHRS